MAYDINDKILDGLFRLLYPYPPQLGGNFHVNDPFRHSKDYLLCAEFSSHLLEYSDFFHFFLSLI